MKKKQKDVLLKEPEIFYRRGERESGFSTTEYKYTLNKISKKFLSEIKVKKKKKVKTHYPSRRNSPSS